jgi:hypothetical protein
MALHAQPAGTDCGRCVLPHLQLPAGMLPLRGLRARLSGWSVRKDAKLLRRPRSRMHPGRHLLLRRMFGFWPLRLRGRANRVPKRRRLLHRSLRPGRRDPYLPLQLHWWHMQQLHRLLQRVLRRRCMRLRPPWRVRQLPPRRGLLLWHMQRSPRRPMLLRGAATVLDRPGLLRRSVLRARRRRRMHWRLADRHPLSPRRRRS